MSHDPVQPASPATGSDASDVNGFHDGSKSAEGAPEGASPTNRSHVDRAEEMVERVAETVSSFTAKWGRRAWTLVSRARQEAEDVWSEAQSIRRGDQR